MVCQGFLILLIAVKDVVFAYEAGVWRSLYYFTSHPREYQLFVFERVDDVDHRIVLYLKEEETGIL